jgi:hypothetical protein
MAKIITIGERKFTFGKNKSTGEYAAWMMKGGGWQLCFAGTMVGLMKYLSHQKALAEKRETRRMIADMCGTSYATACADMGMRKI